MGGALRLFGDELRRRRTEAGISLSELAGRVHYSIGYLSKLESGAKPASPEVARVCDAALGAGGALIALAVRPSEGREVPATPLGGREVWVMGLEPDGGGWFTPMGRREALALGGVTLIGLGGGGPALKAAAHEEAAADAFVAAFGQLRALGRMFGPGTVLPVVIAQAHALRPIIQAAGREHRERWLFLAARHAEYAGWLAQESGNPAAAIAWTDEAVALASGTSDTDMAAHALVRRALIALYRDDAETTIRLARQAQLNTVAGSKIRGLAALREAQGQALAGDSLACEQALERGAALLEPATAAPPELALGPTQLTDLVEMTRGWCLHDLGRPQEAAALLAAHVDRIPAQSKRSRARYGTRLALAYAAAGESERAAELAVDILGAAVSVDSATVRTDLARLARSLTRWRGNSAVRDVYPELIAALQHTNP